MLGSRWSGMRGWLSCRVPDGCGHQFQVLVVQAGEGVTEGDAGAAGDAGGELQDAPFDSFSESNPALTSENPKLSAERPGERLQRTGSPSGGQTRRRGRARASTHGEAGPLWVSCLSWPYPVYGILTGREEAAERAAAQAPAGAPAPTPAELPLPEVSAGGLSGLLEILAARGGQDGLAELADDLSFEIDDLLPLVDAAVMLGLAQVHDAQLEISEQGREFAAAGIDTSKTLFGALITTHAPLIKAILRALRATGDGTLRATGDGTLR